MLDEKDLRAISQMLDTKLEKLKADIMSEVNKNVDDWGTRFDRQNNKCYV